MAGRRIRGHDLFDVGRQRVEEGIDAAGEADFIDETRADKRRAMEHRREIDGVVIGESLGYGMILHDFGIAAGLMEIFLLMFATRSVGYLKGCLTGSCTLLSSATLSASA